MASKYGANHTNAYQTVPAVNVDASKFGGRLKVMSDSYDLTADLAANDKIYMGKLPKGAIVHQVILSFTDLDAAGGTLDVGYEYNETGDSALVDDLDAFIAAADVTSAGTVSMAGQANMVGFQKEMDGIADVVVTVSADTDASSGKIKVSVIYSE